MEKLIQEASNLKALICLVPAVIGAGYLILRRHSPNTPKPKVILTPVPPSEQTHRPVIESTPEEVRRLFNDPNAQGEVTLKIRRSLPR